MAGTRANRGVGGVAQSIGGAAIAIMVLLYKDLKSYRHPGAALTVLCAILLFSGLTALNTHNEREQKLRDKSADDEKAEALTEKIDQTKEQVAKNALTTATSIGRLSGDLNDFKADVKPAELRSQMTVMKDELEKTQAALSPPPRQLCSLVSFHLSILRLVDRLPVRSPMSISLSAQS